MRVLLLTVLGCGAPATRPTTSAEATPTEPSSNQADVVAVEVTGDPSDYRFSVTLRSDDTGCDQYANWWEVVSEDGALLYRRILAHSHVQEQPFTRSGGPVPIQPDQIVWIRGHHDPGGYAGAVFTGSVAEGFREAAPATGFGPGLETTQPLPDGCAF